MIYCHSGIWDSDLLAQERIHGPGALGGQGAVRAARSNLPHDLQKQVARHWNTTPPPTPDGAPVSPFDGSSSGSSLPQPKNSQAEFTSHQGSLDSDQNTTNDSVEALQAENATLQAQIAALQAQLAQAQNTSQAEGVSAAPVPPPPPAPAPPPRPVASSASGSGPSAPPTGMRAVLAELLQQGMNNLNHVNSQSGSTTSQAPLDITDQRAVAQALAAGVGRAKQNLRPTGRRPGESLEDQLRRQQAERAADSAPPDDAHSRLMTEIRGRDAQGAS